MKLNVKRWDNDATLLSQTIIPMQRTRKIESVNWDLADPRMLIVEPKAGHETELRALFDPKIHQVREVA